MNFSLEGSGLYVDSYGFKHDKSNENDRLQYICVKLTQFYHSKSHSTDEQVWRTLIKSYQNSSTVPVRWFFEHQNMKANIVRSLVENVQNIGSTRYSESSSSGILAHFHFETNATSSKRQRIELFSKSLSSFT